MATTEKRDVILHGHRLVYRIAWDELGAGRPVLLLIHGLGGSSATWREVIPAFAPRYTVVAPDLLGHGESDKPSHDYSLGAHANVLRDLMIAVGFERATVVGQSLGGGVALQLAYQHPQRCERLVLVSSGGLGSEVSWLLRALTLPGVEYLMPVLFPSFVRNAGNALSRRLRGLGLRAPRLEEEWRTYVSLTEPGNRSSFMRTLRSVVDPAGQAVSARDRLYLASQVPTLILWGRHDRIIPVEHAFAAHEAIPQSRLVIFEDSGHFPQAEEPQRFFEVVCDFVDTTEPGRRSEAELQTLLSRGAPA